MTNESINKKILYLDTSSETAVLAIFDGNAKLVEEKWEAGRELSKTLTKKYLDTLSKAGFGQNDLAGVCVFIGPGSFTGLRIGISFANGLAFGMEIPIYETRTMGKINLAEPRELALPFYGAEPKITVPKEKK